MQTGGDNDRIRDIQRLLNLDDFSEKTQREELEKYCLALDSDDQLNSGYFQQMRDEELDLFRSQSNYKQWNKSPKQSLLILSGYNNKSISSIDLCWMSPVATAKIRDLGRECGRPIYAYSILPQSGKLVYEVLPAILLQLLKQKIHALRDEKQYAELLSALHRFQDRGKLSKSDERYEDRMLATLHDVALSAVNFYDESESVYIIVDRVDRCRDWKNKVDHRKILLKCLAKLVEGARCKLKVLVVVNGHSWSVGRYEDIIGGNMKEKGIIIHEEEQNYKTN